MMEIYTFDKSLQERLVELTEILSSRGEVVPATQIQTEWSYHIELVLEPVGWQALWKISRFVCEDFQIHYPTIVVVEVEHVDFADLSALVKIVAVQDEISLPDKYDVPLIELYPTHSQENSALDMVGTASCIDQLRFFYNYLWMPWDIDDDDNTDWVSVHLETRIRLFFDMKRGVVSKETCDIIRGLIREGREIHQQISKLEDSISEEEEPNRDIVDEGKTCQLMKLHFRLQQIKTEMEVLENPAMREVLAKNRSTNATNGREKDLESREKQKVGHFVWAGGNWDCLKTTMDIAERLFPQGIPIKISGCLQDTFHACEPGDFIVLGDGHHQIRGAGNLEDGGTIKGISEASKTVLSSKETETAPSLLDFSGFEVLLENLSMDVGDLRAGVIARTGVTRVVNCSIYSLGESMVKLGIVVLPGAKLILESTKFSGLGTGVVIYEGGEVIMTSCTFENCAEGIQLNDKGKLVARSCSLTNFKEYAIRMETRKYLKGSENKCGGMELLQDIKEILVDKCIFENNGKGDIALKSRSATTVMRLDTPVQMDFSSNP